MSVGLLDVFFGEVSIRVFCPFLHWIICFLGVEFDKFSIDFGYDLTLAFLNGLFAFGGLSLISLFFMKFMPNWFPYNTQCSSQQVPS